MIAEPSGNRKKLFSTYVTTPETFDDLNLFKFQVFTIQRDSSTRPALTNGCNMFNILASLFF